MAAFLPKEVVYYDRKQLSSLSDNFLVFTAWILICFRVRHGSKIWIRITTNAIPHDRFNYGKSSGTAFVRLQCLPQYHCSTRSTSHNYKEAALLIRGWSFLSCGTCSGILLTLKCGVAGEAGWRVAVRGSRPQQEDGQAAGGQAHAGYSRRQGQGQT